MMKYETLYGLPVVVTEHLYPGEGAVDAEEFRVYLHPTVAYAMEAAADARDMDAMSDPTVMIEASIRWQTEVIERAAAGALANIDALMDQQDWVREQRRNDALLAVRLENARRFVHRGRQHRWTRDMLRLTAKCSGCGLAITEESAHRLGIELGDDYGRPMGSLSVMVDGEWREVHGIRNVSFSREDGAR